MSSPGVRPEVQYLFVDGAYFRRAMEYLVTRYFADERPAIDLRSLGSQFRRVFYYDCLPSRKSGESAGDYEMRIAPHVAEFNAIRELPGFHVREGLVRRESRRNTQKGVDISMAVDMLTHTMRGNMDRATLLTGDLDFKPLIDALVQEGMYVNLWFEPSSTGEELVFSADASTPITIDLVHQWSTPSFRERCTPPQAYFGSEDETVRSRDKIRSGVTAEGEQVNIYTDGECHWLETRVRAAPNHVLYVTHRELELIERFTADKFVAVQLDPPAT